MSAASQSGTARHWRCCAMLNVDGMLAISTVIGRARVDIHILGTMPLQPSDPGTEGQPCSRSRERGTSNVNVFIAHLACYIQDCGRRLPPAHQRHIRLEDIAHSAARACVIWYRSRHQPSFRMFSQLWQPNTYSVNMRTGWAAWCAGARVLALVGWNRRSNRKLLRAVERAVGCSVAC
jgi:hypothetical protein